VIVLKLGGSVISDKRRPYSLRTELLKEIGKVLKEKAGELVVVHGGGSFGHPKVKELEEKGYSLKEKGYEVIRVMNEMTNKVTEALGDPFAPYSTPSAWAGELLVGPIREALEAGWIPVLQGNVVPPGRVVSGDELVVELAEKLGAELVGLATDVDGVYRTWPPQGPPLKEASPCSVEAKGSEGIDVTGGMKKKLEELAKIAGKSEVYVFNGFEVRNYKLLLEGKGVGTRVVPC
jgi:isopentenyl phosphate kinase